ncbi:tRNA lysidine(34) synthetase TilS [Aeromicrobium sp.]|uniref:tRNA lysidine(34) synthetase TilS n=1 Tax=Aeromicrobium sp. TaxID=1871063 RepID=UPI003D6A590F
MGGALDPVVAEGRRRLRATLDDLEPGSRVEVALSGGADSLALAACLAFVAPHTVWTAGAVVVDHDLQPGSAEVAAHAARQARELGLEVAVVSVEVGTAGGPEAAARDARHAVLRSREADAVLLGHTLDDQAETVLLGLGRGSGPRSLSGMPAVDGIIRRPFLGLRRADTERICTASGLTWWSDPHNADPSFRRSRVRHEVLPLLEDALGGGVAEALARTADQLRADTALLDELAAQVADPCDIPLLAAMPAALRTRVLRRAALEAGADGSELAAVHVGELDRLVTDWHGQTRVELPGRVSAIRVGDALQFQSTPVAG